MSTNTNSDNLSYNKSTQAPTKQINVGEIERIARNGWRGTAVYRFSRRSLAGLD